MRMISNLRLWLAIAAIVAVVAVSFYLITAPKQVNTSKQVEPIGLSGSPGISREENSKLKPLQPSQLAVERVKQTFVMTWVGTGSDIVEYYQVYRKGDKEATWLQIGKVKVVGDNVGSYKFTDADVRRTTIYVYGVTARDIYGNESAVSESSAIVYE